MSLSLGIGKYFNNLNNPSFIVFFEIVELLWKLVWTNREIVEPLWKLVWKRLESCLNFRDLSPIVWTLISFALKSNFRDLDFRDLSPISVT